MAFISSAATVIGALQRGDVERTAGGALVNPHETLFETPSVDRRCTTEAQKHETPGELTRELARG
jgi:hypothetical protein